MKSFVFDSAIVDRLNIARRGRMECFVDKILRHRGKPKSLRNSRSNERVTSSE